MQISMNSLCEKGTAIFEGEYHDNLCSQGIFGNVNNYPMYSRVINSYASTGICDTHVDYIYITVKSRQSGKLCSNSNIVVINIYICY
jgi:hypothetical protein